MHPTLTVDLHRIAENYRRLAGVFTGEETGAVVKANAYGLGAVAVAEKLIASGCRTLFVATLEEGIELRAGLAPSLIEGEKNKKIRIAVFTGPYKGEEVAYVEHELIPVINHISQLERWMLVTHRHASADYMLHVDTGMTRLGLSISDVEWLQAHGTKLLEKKPLYLMSHLACASEPEHAKNQEQLKRFAQACAHFKDVKKSFCNSAGIYLGEAYHGDLARPGCSLYGITPNPSLPNPVQHVADLSAPVIMIRNLDCDEDVGYGATRKMKKGSRIAIVQMGYADGLLRYLSNKMHVYAGDEPCAVLGRVSMDMIAVDVTHLPEQQLHAGMMIDILCKHQTVDQLAQAADTIGYEIFTRVGNRVERVYR